MNWFEALVQWLHIFFGIFWMGGVLFSNFVLGPQLMTMPGDQLRAFMVPFARRADRVILPAASLTILLGIFRGIAFGDIASIADVTGTDYGRLWLIGLVAAVFTFVWGMRNARSAAANIEAGADPRQATGTALRNIAIEMLGFAVILTTMILMHFASES